MTWDAATFMCPEGRVYVGDSPQERLAAARVRLSEGYALRMVLPPEWSMWEPTTFILDRERRDMAEVLRYHTYGTRTLSWPRDSVEDNLRWYVHRDARVEVLTRREALNRLREGVL